MMEWTVRVVAKCSFKLGHDVQRSAHWARGDQQRSAQVRGDQLDLRAPEQISARTQLNPSTTKASHANWTLLASKPATHCMQLLILLPTFYHRNNTATLLTNGSRG